MEQIINFKINKIDFDLKKYFENVYVIEKNNKNTRYFQINANKIFLFENCKKRIEVKVAIVINDMYSESIKWSYALNPLNEDSEVMLRVSSLDNIANDIYEVAYKRKMLNEYFSQLDEQFDLIVESTATLTIDNIIDNIINKYTTIVSKNVVDDKIIFETKEIKISDKFNIEREINNLSDVKLLSYFENTLKLEKNAS